MASPARASSSNYIVEECAQIEEVYTPCSVFTRTDQYSWFLPATVFRSEEKYAGSVCIAVG